MGAHRGYRERKYAFGQQILTLRTRAALTQIALAEQIGVNRRSVQNWETGESYPKAETLQRLIAVFLAQGMFTPGQEAEDAAQLWQQASQDAPHPLAAFDAAWFARLLAERSSTPTPAHALPRPLAPANALDRLLPQGLVTFLATDIEGSTKRWEHFPQAMQQALVRHHAILHQLTELYHGQVFHTAGDSFICVFADALAALQSALALQRALLAEPWPEVVAPLRVRMALHNGAATTHDEGYVAEPTLNRLSRILALSQGGQILLTQATVDLIGARWPEEVTRRDLGVQQLRDVTVPLQLWQVLVPDLPTTDHRPPTTDRRSITHTDDSSPPHPFTPSPIIDWGEAIDVPALYGREQELATLTQWVVQEHCRVVNVLGLGGIGKSALAISLMHQVSEHFQVVLWRSLRDAPACEALLEDCLQVLAPQPLREVPASLEGRLSLLMEHLREQRALLVLDNLESLLSEGESSGRLRSGYEGYGQLLRRVGETAHQSCLLLTSREKPADLEPLEGNRRPVRALRLAGLATDASEQLLAEKEVVGLAHDRARLVEVYVGNPLALNIVAQTIVELFGGEIAPFLQQGEVIFGSVRELLDEQFARLSAGEQTVLLWLAILREPVSLEELRAVLVTPLTRAQLLEAMEALHRRSLLERGKRQGTFTLQAVVLEYATGRLIAEASREIEQGNLARLIEYGFSLANAKDYVRQAQERLLVAPLLAHVQSVYQERAAVEEHLLALLDQQRTWAHYAQGYAPANVLALLRELRGHLRRLNLSQLAIRGAFLQGVEMQDTLLSGATLRETVWTSALDAIWAVAISKSGQYWAAGSRWGHVRVWREAGKLLHLTWQAHSSTVATLAFSPDEGTLATGSFDGSVKLWNLERGTLLWTSWRANNVQRLAFAPDGRTLASSGADAVIQLWDARSGTHLRTLNGHSRPVYALAWSPDGSMLASGGLDARIRLWDLSGAQPELSVRILQGHSDWVFSLAFTPDGRTLASANWNGTLKLWDIESQRVRETVSGHSGQVWGVAWSPDGNMMASCEWDKTIWLWDIGRSTYRAVLHGHSAGVHGLAFTPDSHSLLSGSDDGTLRVWDVESGQCVRIMQGYAVSLYDVAWSPDGARIASAGSDLLVTIWDAAGITSPRALRGHSWNVYGVGWSPDGRWLASSGWDNAIRVWDATTGSEVKILQSTDHVDTSFYGVAWSPDGTVLASGSYQHGVQVWEMSTGAHRWVGRAQPTRIRRVVWSPDGTRLASGGEDGSVCLWDGSDGRLLQQFQGHRGVVMSIAWSPDGTRLASGGSGSGGGGEIFVWEVSSGQCLRAWSEPGAIVYALAWNPNTSVLLSSGGDGSMRWWDIQSGECLAVRQGHQGAIQSLSVSPDRGMVASCGDDGAINIWDIESGEYLRTLRGDRPYERLDISGVKGLTEAQKTTLRMLGAVEMAPSPDIQQRDA
jgi:WD40 repeat protein/class 3 adenylate cyclase/DNA-binding XRE family transcriptional regulator